MYETTLHFTESLAVRSVNRFWRRSLGVSFLIAYSLMIISLIGFIVGKNTSWYVGALGALIGLVTVFLGAIYVYNYRDAVRKYRALDRGQVHFSFDDKIFTLESSSGKSEMRWNIIKEVWIYADSWLVFFARSQYFTIPIADVNTQQQEILRAHFAQAGAKVA